MAVETNKNQWVSNFANAIGANNSNPEGGKGEGNVDKYASLETTSYKDMLSSKIQASNARDQAMKYVGNSLSGAGFSGQGMAESTRAGIMGNYQKAIMGADETHQANLLDIAQKKADEQEATGNEKWQSAMTMLNQAQSQEDLDYLKANFYDDFTDDQKKMFDYYYASYSKGFEDPTWIEKNTTNSQGFTSYQAMLDAGIKTENIKYDISDVANEAMLLFDRYTTGRQNGDAVRLQHHGGGSQNGIYLIYYNGKWYKTDKAHYDNATNSAFLENSVYQSGKGSFTER